MNWVRGMLYYNKISTESNVTDELDKNYELKTNNKKSIDSDNLAFTESNVTDESDEPQTKRANIISEKSYFNIDFLKLIISSINDNKRLSSNKNIRDDMTQVTQNLHTLFVRNISKNITKEAIWNTITNLRLGTISNIITKIYNIVLPNRVHTIHDSQLVNSVGQEATVGLVTQNLHTLFVRNISKNVTKEAIWNTIAFMRFGTISNIIINACADDNNNTTAIVYYENWNMSQPAFIRRMLESSKTIDILYHYESPPWVMSQYDDTLTFASPPIIPNGIKHRKIKKDTQCRNLECHNCYAPTKASREKTYVIEENVRKNSRQ